MKGYEDGQNTKTIFSKKYYNYAKISKPIKREKIN